LNKLFYFTILSLLFSNLNAQETQNLAKELNLFAGTKASVQWKRVFSSQRRMEKYRLDLLSKEQRDSLEKYLINHAADSEQPIVPGL